MPLLRDGTIAEDDWTTPADGAPLPDGPVLVDLGTWRAHRDALSSRSAPVGIRLKADDDPEELADHLGSVDLIALEFPAFTDGRAYSAARVLRERLGYTGELRAVDNVLRDQFVFMHRCGFDSLEVEDEGAVEAWRQAIGEISGTYQPAVREVKAVRG